MLPFARPHVRAPKHQPLSVILKDDPPTEDNAERQEPITGWDAEFVKVDQATLFEMILVRVLFCQPG